VTDSNETLLTFEALVNLLITHLPEGDEAAALIEQFNIRNPLLCATAHGADNSTRIDLLGRVACIQHGLAFDLGFTAAGVAPAMSSNLLAAAFCALFARSFQKGHSQGVKAWEEFEASSPSTTH
jgi:hypothetical protein